MFSRFLTKQLPALALAGTIVLGFVAWKKDQSAPSTWSATDTVPKKEHKIKDFEDARRELEKAEQKLEEAMENLVIPEPPTPPAEPKKIKADLELALKEVDTKQLKADLEEALKELDGEKIRAEVAQALKEVEGDKIRMQVDAALAKIDKEQLKKDIQASLEKVDVAQLKEEMARIKEEDIRKVEVALQHLRPQVEAEMKKAKEEMANAKKELKAYEDFVNSLANEGLLDKNQYTIEHKDGQLIIDGKVQPADVYNKHRSFLEKYKRLVITKNSDGLNISNHQ